MNKLTQKRSLPAYDLPGVKLVPISSNSKTGRITVTYLTQATCPSSCGLRNQGCYAELGLAGIQTRRLNSHSVTPTEAAQNECIVIRRYARDIRRGNFAPIDIPTKMRLHVVGDVIDWGRARELSIAVGKWSRAVKRWTGTAGTAWVYTHNWRVIPRRHWFGPLNALASVENSADAVSATNAGYMAARIVREFPTARVYRESSSEMLVIPCPAQTGGVSGNLKINCQRCGLCARDLKGMAIGFEAHGARRARVSELVSIGGVDC